MSRHGAYYQNIIPYSSKYHDRGKFGRMFGNLPAFAEDTTKVRNALMDIGKEGGIMDAKDDLTDPVKLITQLDLQVNNPNSPVMTAGITFLAQFIDHDMTFDPTSSLERQVDPEFIANFRTPSLGLDNVYGSGPAASPHQYDMEDGFGGIKFLLHPLGVTGAGNIEKFDLPRNTQNTALIGDPRNDENLIVSQLQVIFLRFHNKIVDHLHAKFPTKHPGQLFTEAQELVRWHYQWIIVHEFLPLICGQKVVDDVMENGRKFYHWNNEPFIPVEFSVAAYRFGHTLVRPSYRANFGNSAELDATGNKVPFFAMIFDHNVASNNPDPTDLRGGKRANRRFIDWGTFFNFMDGTTRPNKMVDTKISSPLFNLLGFPAGEVVSLPQRNLLRHLTFKLPSGQRVAYAMGMEPMDRDVFDDFKKYKVNLENSTPLWFYILKEAEVLASGVSLGPVGARITMEVFAGLLLGDNSSYLSQNPFWKPSLPCFEAYRSGKNFTIADLIKVAEGAVPIL